MSLSAAAEIAEDQDFIARATMAAAQLRIPYAESFVCEHVRRLALDTGVLQAYESSLISFPYHSRRCHDPALITDEMIMGAVRALKSDLDQEQDAVTGLDAAHV